MPRATQLFILILLGSLALSSCGSCSSCSCGKESAKEPRLFPTRASGFALRTPGRQARKVVRDLANVARMEPTRIPDELPTPVPEVELPEGFPEDVPLLEGSRAFAVQELAGDARNVLFHVDENKAEVFRHYRSSMQEEGWEITQEYEANHQSFLSFKKGQMIANMTISTDPRTGKRVVGIMYQEEEELPFPEF